MNILLHVPKYLPTQNSGGEAYLHLMAQNLKGDIIAVEDSTVEREYQGIKIRPEINLDQFYRWADVVITHLGKVGKAMNYCRKHRKPLIYIYHNTFRITQLEYRNIEIKVIYNSKWVESVVNHKRREGFVYYAPIRKFKPGKKYITLINCNENKGGDLFIELAEALPEYEFLGVKGYGKQITTDRLPNLIYIENTPNIEKVFSETHTLLVPSKYESFGMAACEALKSGIRVIASPTPGLKESLNDGGIYATDKTSYIYNIKNGENPGKWDEPITDINKLNDFICTW